MYLSKPELIMAMDLPTFLQPDVGESFERKYSVIMFYQMKDLAANQISFVHVVITKRVVYLISWYFSH